MDLSVPLDKFDIDYIYFGESVTNNVILNGIFNRIYYSNNNFTINGLSISCKFNDIKIERYYNKYKLSFNKEKNMLDLNRIHLLEKDILSKIYIQGKTPIYKLEEQLKYGSIKINDYINDLNILNLKISGIWQSKTNYGITFRFQINKSIFNHRLKNI